MRTCTACEEDKPLDDFQGNRRRCRSCRSDQMKAARWAREGEPFRDRPDGRICTGRHELKPFDQFFAGPNYRNGIRRQCMDCHSREAKNNALKRNFGITLEQYEEMFAAREGRCDMCGQPETMRDKNGAIKRLAVDHDHLTGEVRGLLCARHNTGLGLLGDSIEGLEAALAYLKKGIG